MGGRRLRSRETHQDAPGIAGRQGDGEFCREFRREAATIRGSLTRRGRTREECEKDAIREALTDERQVSARLEKFKVPPAASNGQVGTAAAVITMVLVVSLVITSFSTLVGMLALAASVAIALVGFGAWNRMDRRHANAWHERTRMEASLGKADLATKRVAESLKVSARTIGLIREMPLEMKTKERLLRKVAGRENAEDIVEALSDGLEGARAVGENLEYFANRTLPQLLDRLLGGKERV